METELIESFHEKLSGFVPDSLLFEIYKELRTDILSRKESISILDLHTATKNCRKCNLSGVVPELPKWNVTNPDVMFVVESPNMSPEAVELFLSSLKSSGFSSAKVCLTYVNRCPAKKKFSESEIANCLGYLHSEIQLLNPKLIVTLGLLPLVSLIGCEVKMKDYRGNVFWLGYWPIVPSYSPTYALKSGKVQIDQFMNDIKTAHTFVNKEEKYHDSKHMEH
jgi:DNA polymerase